MNKHIVVIGSGFGGLGAACRLAAKGCQEDVSEKRVKPGRRAFLIYCGREND